MRCHFSSISLETNLKKMGTVLFILPFSKITHKNYICSLLGHNWSLDPFIKMCSLPSVGLWVFSHLISSILKLINVAYIMGKFLSFVVFPLLQSWKISLVKHLLKYRYPHWFWIDRGYDDWIFIRLTVHYLTGIVSSIFSDRLAFDLPDDAISSRFSLFLKKKWTCVCSIPFLVLLSASCYSFLLHPWFRF